MALETKRNCSRDTTFCSSLVNPRFLFFPHSAEKYFFCFAFFFFFSSLFLSPHSLPILKIASAGWVLSSAAVPARECQMSRHARDEKERWLPDARGRKTTFSASSKRRMLYRSGSGWLVGWCFRSFVVCAVISFTTVCWSLLRHPHSFTTMHLKSTGGGRVSPDVGFQGFFFLALFFYSFSPLFFLMNRLLSQRLFLRDGLAKTASFSPLYLYGILRIPKNALFSPLHRFAARSECKDPPLENPQGFFTSPVYAIQPVGWHVLRKRGGKQEELEKWKKPHRWLVRMTNRGKKNYRKTSTTTSISRPALCSARRCLYQISDKWKYIAVGSSLHWW